MAKAVNIMQLDPEVPAGVFAELLGEWQVPYRIVRVDCGETLPDTADAVIVLGGAMGVHDEDKFPFLRTLKTYMRTMLDQGTPLFGICLGGQLLSDLAGGNVSSNCRGEKGLVAVELTADGAADQLFAGLSGPLHIYQWHNDSFTIPPAARHLAGSAVCPGQAFRLGMAWGVQFHPEVDIEIVRRWSKDVPERTALVADFSAAEPEHRRLARLLLGNFLTAAGVRFRTYQG